VRRLCSRPRNQCRKPEQNPVLLQELLDNSLLTAKQHRYEDAAARLYRAMEMQGQIWLAEASEGAFVNGRMKAGVSVPAALRDWEVCARAAPSEIKLSLEQIFQALHRLRDPRAAAIVEDLSLDRKSQWRQATEKRNSSILGHGTQSIGQDGFEEMKRLASQFLGFHLDQPKNPIPFFDVRWTAPLRAQ